MQRKSFFSTPMIFVLVACAFAAGHAYKVSHTSNPEPVKQKAPVEIYKAQDDALATARIAMSKDRQFEVGDIVTMKMEGQSIQQWVRIIDTSDQWLNVEANRVDVTREESISDTGIASFQPTEPGVYALVTSTGSSMNGEAFVVSCKNGERLADKRSGSWVCK